VTAAKKKEEEEVTIVYKALKDGGISQYQGYQWPLPDEWNDTPGEWVELDPKGQTLTVCDWGLHGYTTEDIAVREGGTQCPFIYEMEIVGKTENNRTKVCGYKARLLRLVRNQDGPVVRFADLVWQ